ncbi:hypothetical protein LAZ67_13002101 [Cordylochernes scorpioides]|uniref:Reverse transcriptase domain-containing protein n=1 Tax=Cordylochernes scorpioides TaxID=51811 RepID=A0ABY6L4D8_9ARAC|nr:hypothetical protein LAZ67_13002101 [Cordylochernes scorpioides]
MLAQKGIGDSPRDRGRGHDTNFDVYHRDMERQTAFNTDHKIFYLNNEREVKFTYESETFYKKLTKGCPQGEPLSPLLWNILLNDLLINFESMNADIICYADDATISCWNKTIEGLKTASEYSFNYVIQWCNRK